MLWSEFHSWRSGRIGEAVGVIAGQSIGEPGTIDTRISKSIIIDIFIE